MAPVSGCLVIMCGVPCSGKSTAAAELASALSAKGIRTTTVDEPSLLVVFTGLCHSVQKMLSEAQAAQRKTGITPESVMQSV